MEYIVAVKFTHPIQRLIANSKNWVVLDTGIEISEQMYQRDSWQMPGKIVILRQRTKDRPQAPGKQSGLLQKKKFIRIIVTQLV